MNWVVLALVVLVGLMLIPQIANAKVVAIGKAKGDVITLTDEVCKSDLMLKVKPEFQPKFMAATYYVSSKNITVPGCYMPWQDAYITIWEDGDVFELPISFFAQTKV
jgi:hypothetical protein